MVLIHVFLAFYSLLEQMMCSQNTLHLLNAYRNFGLLFTYHVNELP